MELRPYQEAALAAVREQWKNGLRRVGIVSCVGSGKCLGRGTPVLMFDGTTKAVEVVRPGDLLMGPDSKPRRVVGTCQGRETLYRVIPTKGDAYVVNESHILSLKKTPTTRGEEHRIVNMPVLEWLSVASRTRSNLKGWRTGVEFASKETHPDLPPYLLGLWLGDGSIGRPEITKPDEEVLAYIQRYAAERGLCVRTRHGSSGCPTHAVSTGIRGGNESPYNHFLEALRSVGVVDARHIPSNYLVNNRTVRLQVLAGLMDSDGSLGSGCYDWISISERLANDVCFLARSLGFAAYKTPCKKTCTNNGATGDYFRVSISGELSEIPCRIPRKQAPPRRQKKSVLVTGLSVERMGVGDYFGFELEGPDRLFLLGDFTVTHNTRMGSEAARRALTHPRGRVLWMAHRTDLIDQAAATLRQITGEKPGIVQSSRKSDSSARIQVASIQTLVRRGELPQASLIIVDEVHHLPADQWAQLLDGRPEAYLIGLTATPARPDGKPLSGVLDVLVPTVQPSELVDSGVLVPSEVIAPELGNGPEKGIAMDPVEAICRWAADRRTIVFAKSIPHAMRLTEDLRARGIPAGCVTEETSDCVRKGLYRQLANKAIRVLCNVNVATEGLDIPSIDCCVLARRINHASQYIQCVGRALRASPGKGSALLIDLSGCVERFGPPEMDRHYSIDGDEGVTTEFDEESKRRLLCKQCGSMRTGSVCPVCGAASGPPPRSPEPEIEDVPMVQRVVINRADQRAQEAIRSYAQAYEELGSYGPWPRAGSERFRRRFGHFPDATWLEMFTAYLKGSYRSSPLPPWWPGDVRNPKLVSTADLLVAPTAAE